ncbi:hypothetical protein BC831DRAFT_284275 [Entophlyctis helioformis]|nr:hypothetical protein BC831DRAFT_284275 [Entophlyctis helioformis]
MVADLVKLDADVPLPLEYCVLEASQGKLTQYYYVNPEDFDEDESATLLSGGCIHKQGIIVWHMYGTGPHSSDTNIPRYGSLVTLESDTALKICAFDTAKIAKQPNMHGNLDDQDEQDEHDNQDEQDEQDDQDEHELPVQPDDPCIQDEHDVHNQPTAASSTGASSSAVQPPLPPPPPPPAAAVPSANELLTALTSSISGGGGAVDMLLRHLGYVLADSMMVQPQATKHAIHSWIVTVMQMMIHRTWTRRVLQTNAAKLQDDTAATAHSDTFQKDARQAAMMDMAQMDTMRAAMMDVDMMDATQQTYQRFSLYSAAKIT